MIPRVGLDCTPFCTTNQHHPNYSGRSFESLNQRKQCLCLVSQQRQKFLFKFCLPSCKRFKSFPILFLSHIFGFGWLTRLRESELFYSFALLIVFQLDKYWVKGVLINAIPFTIERFFLLPFFYIQFNSWRWENLNSRHLRWKH